MLYREVLDVYQNSLTQFHHKQRNQPKVVVSINLLLYQISDREQEHLALMLGLNINGLLVESVLLNVEVSSISKKPQLMI